MIQRTVIDSKRSAVDQRLVTGVGTLGTQYAAVLAAGNRALDTVPNNGQLQRAIVDDNLTRVKEIASAASGGGLLVTVEDPTGRVLSDPAPDNARPIASPRAIGVAPRRIATVQAWVNPKDLIQQVQEVDPEVMLGLATGNQLKLGEETVALPNATLALGKPFRIEIDHTRYRGAARKVGDSEAVALYPQHRLDSYTRTIRVRVALLMGLLLVLIGAGAALAVRSLTHTLRAFADGIRAVASGRFDQRLPVRGGDEFSQFGAVFNQMSSQLEQRIEELDSERRRVQEFGQRFGAALAATHDVAGLLEIVVDSAVQLARAQGARLLVADEGTDVLVEQLRRGDLGAAAGLLDAPVRYGEGIEGRALQTRQAVIGDEPAPLLAAPLVAEERVLGLLTLVGDPARPFGRDDAERVGSLV